MRITRIHLFNFRSVSDLTLDLSDDGLHALTGSFGSGKSSFLTGLRFCLFGDNGAAGKNTDLRRRGSDTSQDAGCEVEFTHENDTYIARRWLRHSNTAKGVKETAQASLLRNGHPIEGITASTLTREVTTITGLTAKAYTSANLIPQGEVAELMAASPTEVQKLIEEHTGLSVLTTARDQARKAANNAAAAASALPGSQEDADVAGSEESDARRELTQASERLEAATAAQRDAESIAKDAQAEAWSLHKQAESAARAAAATAHAQAALEVQQKQVQDLTEQAQASGAASLDEATGQVTQLDNRLEVLSDAGIAVKTAAAAVERSEAALTAAEAKAAQAKERSDNLSAEHPDLEAETTRWEQQATDANKRSNQHNARSYAFTQEANRLGKAINTLTSHDHDEHTCPTCGQDVANHDELVATLTDSHDRALNCAAEESAHADGAHKEAMQAQAEMKKLTGLRTQMDDAARHYREALSAAESSNQEADQASAHLAETMTTVIELCADEGIEIDVTDHTTVRSGAGELFKKLREQRNHAAAAVAAHNRLIAAQKQVAQAETDLAKAQSASVVAPSSEDINAADQAAADARSVADAATAERNRLAEEAAEARAAHGVVEAHAEHKAAEWRAKEAALEEAAVARGEADALRALRADLLAEYTDAICRSASDLLGRFGGEYVAFHLDADFVPRAELADGTLVRTAILSGGESALVGLAFRVAVTLVITGGGLPEQMLCDEVTNYLDEAGRRAVLSALTMLFPSVLLISHTAEAEDYATAMHRVERGELEPTRWVA